MVVGGSWEDGAGQGRAAPKPATVARTLSCLQGAAHPRMPPSSPLTCVPLSVVPVLLISVWPTGAVEALEKLVQPTGKMSSCKGSLTGRQERTEKESWTAAAASCRVQPFTS